MPPQVDIHEHPYLQQGAFGHLRHGRRVQDGLEEDLRTAAEHPPVDLRGLSADDARAVLRGWGGAMRLVPPPAASLFAVRPMTVNPKGANGETVPIAFNPESRIDRRPSIIFNTEHVSPSDEAVVRNAQQTVNVHNFASIGAGDSVWKSWIYRPDINRGTYPAHVSSARTRDEYLLEEFAHEQIHGTSVLTQEATDDWPAQRGWAAVEWGMNGSLQDWRDPFRIDQDMLRRRSRVAEQLGLAAMPFDREQWRRQEREGGQRFADAEARRHAQEELFAYGGAQAVLDPENAGSIARNQGEALRSTLARMPEIDEQVQRQVLRRMANDPVGVASLQLWSPRSELVRTKLDPESVPEGMHGALQEYLTHRAEQLGEDTGDLVDRRGRVNPHWASALSETGVSPRAMDVPDGVDVEAIATSDAG